ncbi:MAG TPA: hypothetical protein VGO47_01055 [Chlamydiales bacterium]|nr:hypothetical protein [Chlamydiales bacterium]
MCTLNQPLPNSERKTTLIVAPTALLDQVRFCCVPLFALLLALKLCHINDILFLLYLKQWKREIEQRTAAGKYKVYIHHGNTKLKSTVEVKNHDVCDIPSSLLISLFISVHTYHTVVRHNYLRYAVYGFSQSEKEGEKERARRPGGGR